MTVKQIVNNFVIQGAKDEIERQRKQMFDSKVDTITDVLYFYQEGTMKELRIALEESEHEKLVKQKGNNTWKEWLMRVDNN